MFHFVWRLLRVMLGMCFVTPALATDRFFPNMTTVSPNGRFKVEAKSPDNPPVGWGKPFARDFTYTLTDTATQRVVWTTKQGNERSPTGIWIHDSGWVVAVTSDHQLMTWSPKDGKIDQSVDILKQFPEAEYNRYVHFTTAGLMWAGFSRWSFLELDNKLYFVIRTHWGRHVVMDTATRSVVSGKEQAAKGEDHRWVLATLKRVVPLLGPQQLPNSDYGDLRLALHIAAENRIEEAAELVHAIEKIEVMPRESMSVSFGDRKVADGLVDPFAFTYDPLRLEVQRTLRKLGREPMAPSGIVFTRVGTDSKAPAIEVASPALRARGLSLLRGGLTPLEVLKLAGNPDAVVTRSVEMSWEYHIGGEEPRTIRAVWSEGNDPKVTKIERLSPPTWMTEDLTMWR